MSERKKADWLIIVAVLAALVLLPLLYVLSAGPVCLLMDNGHLPEHTADFAYAPIIALGDLLPGVNDFMEWYIGLWVP